MINYVRKLKYVVLFIIDILVMISGVIFFNGYFATKSGFILFLLMHIAFALIYALVFKAYRLKTRIERNFEFFYIILMMLAIYIESLALSFLPIFAMRENVIVHVCLFIISTYVMVLTRVLTEVLRKAVIKMLNKPNPIMLIIGAGASGRLLHNFLSEKFELGQTSDTVACFVDDDKNKIGTDYLKTPIEGPINNIKQIIEKYEIKTVIISIPTLSDKRKTEILDLIRNLGVDIKTVPSIDGIKQGKSAISVKSITIEDLLMRSPAVLDSQYQCEYIKDKTVMITGGGGSIGSEIVRQVCRLSPKGVVILDVYENNAYDILQELNAKLVNPCDIYVEIGSVRDYEKMKQVFDKYKPDVVFHTAAFKHVVFMEQNPDEAVKNNCLGTYNCSRLAYENSIDKFILISTDKAATPCNIMSMSKRICELIVDAFASISTKTIFSSVRFGNVLGSNGSVIPLFKKQIESGGPVKVTHADMVRYFLTIPEAANLIIESGKYSTDGEIFTLTMGDPIKIYDLALRLISCYNLVPNVDIDVVFTGLRPGEQLGEERHILQNEIQLEQDDRISVSPRVEVDFDKLISSLDYLFKDGSSSFDAIKNHMEDILQKYDPMYDK